MYSDNGPRAWCLLLSSTTCTQKLVLIAKLLFALSNNSSICTAFEYRLVALRLLPVLENNYINLTIGTFESLRKISKMSTKSIVTEFGGKLLQLVYNRLNDLRPFEQFTTFYEMCYTAAKQVGFF